MALKSKAALQSGMNADADWRGEDDARTLHKAEEIRMDRDRHTRAKSVLKRQVKASTRALGGTR